jgi:hypothetical protein
LVPLSLPFIIRATSRHASPGHGAGSAAKWPAGRNDAFSFQFGERGSTILAPIIKELFMFRTNRMQRGFDSARGMALLSTRVAAVSSNLQSDTVAGLHLELNGSLHGNRTVLMVDAGVPVATDPRKNAGELAYFDTSGRISTLGKVSGSFGRNKATDVPLGELPNLSSLTLELANHAGSVQLLLAASSTNQYQFKVSGGTGRYHHAYGSGSLTITFHEGSNEYLLALRSGNG